MIPENIVDQITAVQDVINGAVAAGGGIKSSVDLASDLPAAVTGSLNIAGSLSS